MPTKKELIEEVKNLKEENKKLNESYSNIYAANVANANEILRLNNIYGISHIKSNVNKEDEKKRKIRELQFEIGNCKAENQRLEREIKLHRKKKYEYDDVIKAHEFNTFQYKKRSELTQRKLTEALRVQYMLTTKIENLNIEIEDNKRTIILLKDELKKVLAYNQRAARENLIALSLIQNS